MQIAKAKKISMHLESSLRVGETFQDDFSNSGLIVEVKTAGGKHLISEITASEINLAGENEFYVFFHFCKPDSSGNKRLPDYVSVVLKELFRA